MSRLRHQRSDHELVGSVRYRDRFNRRDHASAVRLTAGGHHRDTTDAADHPRGAARHATTTTTRYDSSSCYPAGTTGTACQYRIGVQLGRADQRHVRRGSD